MKIDILVAVAYRGGVEEVLNQTALYLQRKGHIIRVIHGIWQGISWADNRVDFNVLIDTTKGGWKGSYNQIAEEYNDYLKRKGYPDIILCAGWPVLVPLARVASEGKSRVISWLHGDLEAYEESGFGGYAELSEADAHFCINATIEKKILLNISGSRTFRIRNPIDLSRIVYNDAREKYRLAYVGRLAVEKNIPFMLQAFSETSDLWSLDVIGDTDVEGGLEKIDNYCKELGISDRVFFYGWQDNPWEILRDDAAILLTSDREGSPLVTDEALLCGMYVITTPTFGIIEKIVPGENGFIIPFGEVGFLSKLLSYIEADTMPIPKSIVCRESVAYLIEEKELDDFERCLLSVVE